MLSQFAAFVPPPVALKLQQLWDGGCPLVSVLDDRSWDVLADMEALAGEECLGHVAAQMHTVPVDDIGAVNGLFMVWW